jgi:hypothetical protein
VSAPTGRSGAGVLDDYWRAERERVIERATILVQAGSIGAAVDLFAAWVERLNATEVTR